MNQREQIRRDFPSCAAMTEQLRAVFGPGVKPLYFSEEGKTMGKQQAFDGTDVDQLIRLDDMDAKRSRKRA